MYDQQKIERLRRGHEGEDDRDGARYLIDELTSAIQRGLGDPTGSHGTRYRTLVTALASTTDRLGIGFRPPYDSLGALAEAHPGLGRRPAFQLVSVAREPFEPLLDALDRPAERRLLEPVKQPVTGWAQVDAEIDELRRQAAGAASGAERGAVGRLCREVMVSLADAAYDATRHGPLPEREKGQGGGTVTSRIEAVIRIEAAGGSLAELRKLAVKTLGFANKLQHRKDPTDVEMMVCADLTVLTVAAVRRLVD